MKNRFLCLLFVVCTVISARANSTDSLALTPPMGWNSWNCFSCNINEKQIREIADLMVSTGMKDAGYEYLNIDDCWQVGRDNEGNILVDEKNFPSGIKALADYIHSKGLKFGIYSCAGTLTCAGRPGSRGYQFQDARTYAEWGVDYLKYDWCFDEGQNPQAAYKTMSDALKASGRPIVFSICEWGNSQPWTWAKGIGHLWRTTGDIINAFKGINYWGGCGVVEIIDKNADLHKYAGPGHWNDPDMLQVGNGVLTMEENRSHFTMWCMLAAPLLAGNDIRKMDKETLGILTNKEVIAVNQDKLGIQGFRHEVKDSVETWIKPLSDGSWAVAFLNRSEQVRKFSIDWNTFSVTDPLYKMTLTTKDANLRFRDVWEKKDLTFKRKKYQSDFVVGGDDIVMLVISPAMKK